MLGGAEGREEGRMADPKPPATVLALFRADSLARWYIRAHLEDMTVFMEILF